MNDSLATRIGKNIASTRKRVRLTQGQLAEKVGIDPISLSRIERGGATPSLATLDRLAEALGVSLGQLLDGISDRLPTLADSVARELEPLSDANRRFLLEQLQGWASKLKECQKA